MRTTFLVLLLNILLAATVAQRTSQSEQSTRSEAVAKRGDHVMGFSHEATTHHFHLLKGGGEIVVTTNDPSDKTSVEQIRTHLNHIVSMFSNGDFNAAMLIHDTNPPGTATMARLRSSIRYTISEIPQGGKIRIATSTPETTDAVHAFLLFQIVDHKTGEAPTIGN